MKRAYFNPFNTLGFTQPTPIQEKAIPVLLREQKILLVLLKQEQAKQLRLDYPCCIINKQQKFPQALVICPTRELCMQITNDLNSFKRKTDHISVVAVYGGASIGMQIRDLKKRSPYRGRYARPADRPHRT